jgi:uncharacterized protein (TIGR03790 family)
MKTHLSCLAVALCCLFAAVPGARALGPHELLVIANDNSVDSILVARAYMRMRGVPDCNLVRVDLPESLYATNNLITPEEFAKRIWEPVQTQVSERGLTSQILAWAYSCDFPTRVASKPNVSITGITFVRSRLPEEAAIDRGTYISPLFAGPESAEAPVQETQTLDQNRNMLLESMPLPSMMLGYTRQRGNTVEETLAALEKGAASDSQFPRGTVYFTATEDVRSMCRHWQYGGAASAIRSLGQLAVVTNAFPAELRMVGFMTGNRTAPTELATYEPGAYADHLTSFAGAFETGAHTKMTEWLRSGVTATSGTVTEPYSVWHKFPNAYVFVHQLKGCAMIEAIYQATRCPLQFLPMGDPLAKPWAPRPRVSITVPDGPVSGMVELVAATDDAVRFTRFDWLLNGRTVASGRTYLWNSRAVPNGLHTIRAVARGLAPMRHQGFQDVVVDVLNPVK